MPIERARAIQVPKPWGVLGLSPWNDAENLTTPIGEIWFARTEPSVTDPALLLKLIFTSQPLSIQVHPDDAYARGIGLASGKTEAWYILSALGNSQIALGLSETLTTAQFHRAVADGHIEHLVSWRSVSPNEVVVVPAGTIHAIGAGLVIAEIQPHVDATFRLFDYGRNRPLQAQHAAAVASRGPAAAQLPTSQIRAERTILTANNYFVFERLTLPEASAWIVDARQETWLIVLQGSAWLGDFELAQGAALYAQAAEVKTTTGAGEFICLIAYTGGEGVNTNLLRRAADSSEFDQHTVRH